MESKKKSLSEAFVDLINPAPLSYDPEDDVDAETVAKVVDYEDSFSEEEVFRVSRKRNIALIEDGDERYDGRKVSRKSLRLQVEDKNKFEANKISESESLSESEEENEDEDVEETGDESTGSDNELQAEEDVQDLGNFQHISNRGLATELEKGNAVMNQLQLWDNLLEFRIKLQNTLIAANKLPRYNALTHFTSQGGSNFKGEIRRCKFSLTTLLEKLIALQTKMLKSYPETQSLNKIKNESIARDEEICSDTEEEGGGDHGEEEEENEVHSSSDVEKSNYQSGKSGIKELNLQYFSRLLADQHQNYMEYRNATIQKWNDKTRISVGKLSSRNFSTFEQSTLKQIEQILSNRQRLIQRSQLNRSSSRILGQELDSHVQQQQSIVTDSPDNLKTNHDQSKEYDTEIFDDTDYYHQLLRELIERKSSDVTDPVQLGRKWLELQKLRSKMKRKVDTRATKGRKIRYVVHPKLVNFMAPVSQNIWNEEAKTELFNSLFGNRTRQQ